MEEERCPFIKICPRLRKHDSIYGYCLYQPLFQETCNIYLKFVNNPSYRVKRNE